jgi:hypothetical protein
MDGAKAWNSTGKSTEVGGVGPGGLRAAQKCGNCNQHACRLHVIRDDRKSVFTLRIRVFTGMNGAVSLRGRALCGRLSCVLPIGCAAQRRIARESSA